MNTRGIPTIFLVGAALAFAGFIGLAWSAEKEKKEHDAKVADLVKEAKVTIDQAIKTASEKVQGTVVEAELEKKKGKTVWEVEIVGADGKVTEVHVDAEAGTVVAMEEKHKEGKKEKK